MSETAVDIVIRALLAVLLGGLIGLERELRDRPAGIRTHILVTLGACIFTTMSLFGFPKYIGGDRVAAAIVAGIGFIGAGAILRSEGGIVTGITTAASLWGCAAIGMVVGTGFYAVSLILTAIVLIVLELIDWGVDLVARRFQSRRLLLELRGDYRESSLSEVMKILEAQRSGPQLQSYQRTDKGLAFYLRIRTQVPAKVDLQALTDEFYEIPGVAEVTWQ